MSRATLTLLALVTACAGGAGSRANSPIAPLSPKADAPTPDLHVEGNALVANGKHARLFGVSHSGSEYACLGGRAIFEGPTDALLTTAMATWHVNAVRIPLNEHCWLGINGAPAATSGEAYRSAIAEMVALVRAAGMYAILDLHWSAPSSLLAKHQAPMADRDHAPDFWRSVATAFQGDRGVLFDLYNEPYVTTSNAKTSDAWDCWLRGCAVAPSADIAIEWQSAGMQELVDAVRSTGARNVVLVGGLAYANDMSGWLAHRPRDPLGQLAASAHLYNFNDCRDAACWNAQLAPIAAAVPLVTGEIGEDDCAHAFVDSYMAWADARGVSYVGWAWNTWDCKTGPALITSYDGTPTAFGAGLKAHFLATSP